MITAGRAEGAPRGAHAQSGQSDHAIVRDAYRRWSLVYDQVFGGVTAFGRRRAVAAINASTATKVLEVGVGTGLALPLYRSDKRVTGIDICPEMLARARAKVQRRGLRNVDALEAMDAEAMSFSDHSFDVAVAMHVVSVARNPRRLLAEMRRVVRPGGRLLLVNHFAAQAGPRSWLERAMAPLANVIGWRPDFSLSALPLDACTIETAPVRPFGLFTIVSFANE